METVDRRLLSLSTQGAEVVLYYVELLFHIVQSIADIVDAHWLRNHEVHAAVDCFLCVCVFGVASNSVDVGLGYLIALAVCPDSFCCLVAIHPGHVAVHEYQMIEIL